VNGIAGVALLTWRSGWPVILLGIAPLLLALLLRGSRQVPPVKAFAGLLCAPVCIVAWAGLNWAAEEGLSHDTLHWRTSVLLALTIGGLGVLGITVYRFRRSPGRWLLFTSALGGILALALTFFVGGMAITNDWL
jgi:hypothetical protein